MQTFQLRQSRPASTRHWPGVSRQVHRRRHHACRPDEAERGAAAPRWSTSICCRSTRSRRCPTADCASARWCATPTSRGTPECKEKYYACFRRRCFPAPRRSCATWPPPAATCCSARAAPTSASRARARRAGTAATSARPAQAARRSRDFIGRTRFWAQAIIASRPILLTCAWPWLRSKR